MKDKKTLIESIVTKVFEDYKKQCLDESFQSPLLKKIFDANHKPDKALRGRHINSLSDVHFRNMWHDMSRITDDMIAGVYDSPQEADIVRDTPYMQFSNGVTVVFNDKVKGLFPDAEERFLQRDNSQPIDKFYKQNYSSRNRAYNDYMNTHKMWDNDIKNGDKPYFNGDAETRRNSTPSVVKNSYYNKAKDYYKKK